jgi:anaerobic selenocysteine-containing dehydrogenase
MDATKSRRNFLKLTVLGGAAATLGVGFVGSAAANEPVSEDDPAAKALNYKHDTKAVDGSAFPNHTNEQLCSNCQLIQGADGEEWRPCAVFPGKLVAADGWCSAWVAKA